MQYSPKKLSTNQKIRAANATFVEHYAQWASHFVTLTFEEQKNGSMPGIVQIDKLLRHIRATLNWAVWKKRTKYNTKAKILYIPIVEGLNSETLVHVHLLLGNIGSEAKLHEFIKSYVRGSSILGFKYDIQGIHSHDGISWYVSKETYGSNVEAVRWNAALIPVALIPKGHTLLKA